jgi:hypothetical protein
MLRYIECLKSSRNLVNLNLRRVKFHRTKAPDLRGIAWQERFVAGDAAEMLPSWL